MLTGLLLAILLPIVWRNCWIVGLDALESILDDNIVIGVKV